MPSKLMNVDKDFRKLVMKERKNLVRMTKLDERFFTYPIVTKIISNKLKGKPTKIMIRKRRMILE